jgi:dihydroneopterin aldolase
MPFQGYKNTTFNPKHQNTLTLPKLPIYILKFVASKCTEMIRVALEGMKFYAFHGFYPEERKVGNEFILDVFVDIPRFDSEEDNIQDTVNYEDIYNICQNHMDKKYKLLETVAFHIGKDIKERYDQISLIKVRIAKIGPQLGGVVDKAVVEYTY